MQVVVTLFSSPSINILLLTFNYVQYIMAFTTTTTMVLKMKRNEKVASE